MDKVLTVSQLNKYLKSVFEDELVLHNICVKGEVFEFKISSSNTYLVLKEGDCVINCYKPASMPEIEVGTEVMLRGSVNFFPKGGRTSFIFTDAELLGEGKLYADLLKLKSRLKDEGLFDRKRPLPLFINKVAVITSSEGAAIHDFIKTLSSQPFISVNLFHSAVQGEAAAENLVKAFDEIQSLNEQFDVVVLTRGGGGTNDLNVFNSEIVARKVYACDFPVISAIGHEVDYTLCDFCADVRVGTPTMAGELIVSRNNSAYTALCDLVGRAIAAMEKKVTIYAESLSKKSLKLELDSANLFNRCINRLFSAHSEISSGMAILQNRAKSSLTSKVKNLYFDIDNKLRTYESKFRLYSERISAINPANLLGLGYAKIFKDKKSATIEELCPGDNVQVYMKNGSFEARITKINKE